MIRSFPPLADKNSRVLILGSMPGVKSLEMQEYYAHPQNQFWTIMAAVLGQAGPLTYSQKKGMLLKRGVALWDVVRSCRRKGSLDSNLRNIKVNDLGRFLRGCPKVKAVFCNGQTALKLFNRYYGDSGLPICGLPSTSPAYTIPFGRKLYQWRKIGRVIGSIS